MFLSVLHVNVHKEWTKAQWNHQRSRDFRVDRPREMKKQRRHTKNPVVDRVFWYFVGVFHLSQIFIVVKVVFASANRTMFLIICLCISPTLRYIFMKKKEENMRLTFSMQISDQFSFAVAKRIIISSNYLFEFLNARLRIQ